MSLSFHIGKNQKCKCKASRLVALMSYLFLSWIIGEKGWELPVDGERGEGS